MKVPTEPLELVTQIMQCLNVDDVIIRPGDLGWKVFSLDPSHTTMANILIDKDQFVAEEYDLEENRAIFAVNRTMLSNALKVVTSATADLSFKDGKFVLSGDGSKVFFPPLACDLNSIFPDPKFVPNVNIEVDSEDLRKVLKGASLFKGIDQITFEATEEELRISGGSQNSEEVSMAIKQEDCGAFEGTGKTKLPLPALLGIMSTVPKGSIIGLTFGTDLPLTMTWSGTGWNVKWMAAPLIDAEE